MESRYKPAEGALRKYYAERAASDRKNVEASMAYGARQIAPLERQLSDDGPNQPLLPGVVAEFEQDICDYRFLDSLMQEALGRANQ